MSSPAPGGEHQALLACLDQQRNHVLAILEGLPDQALRQPVLPSGWTCLGLVRHLALDVERFWFASIIAAGPVELCEGAQAWQVDDRASPGAVSDLYRQEIDHANVMIENTPLDTAPARWPDEWSGWRLADLRAVMLHVIVETASISMRPAS